MSDFNPKSAEAAEEMAKIWEQMECEIESKVSRLFAPYEDHGHMEYAGESVSQLQHAQQAAQLARDACQPVHVVLGSFFHDIGHLIGIGRHFDKMTRHGVHTRSNVTSIGTRHHEKVGEKYLDSLGFPKCVVDLVKGHVEAKRYMVFKYPDYYSGLSRASQMTLEMHQGGPMSPEEAAEFEQNEHFYTLLDLRRFDDAAKVSDIPLTDNTFYKDACRKLLVAEKLVQSMPEDQDLC